jgi:anti-sigma B factor antagonist
MTEGPVVASVVVGDEALLTFRGDLDLASRDVVLAALTAALDEGATKVTVDLEQVPFVDSTGIGTLLEVCRREAALIVRRPVPEVRRVLELTGLEAVITFDPA